MDFKDLLAPDEVLDFDEDLYQKNLRDHDWSHQQDAELGEDKEDERP